MLFYPLRRAVKRYGVRGTIRAAGARIRGLVALSENHVWYELDPVGARPHRRMPQHLTLRHGDEPDLPLLDELPTVSPVDGRVRIRDGNDLWLVLEDGHPLFSCWIFRDMTPAIAAPGGQLQLSAGTVCLEDSVTAAPARGRGIGPAAWSAIADALGDQGQRHIITKVAVDNVPSRRAVEKAGFDAVALMHFRRFGPRSRTWVDVLDRDRGSSIAEGLSARRSMSYPAQGPSPDLGTPSQA